MEKKRLTAVKARISSIIDGKWVQQEGFNPNYVVTKLGQHISRVRILGTIVDKFLSENKSFAAFTLDDGSGTIRVKAFTTLSILDPVDKGDIVDVIGRVKSYQDEIYIAPESVVKVEPNFELLREVELRSQEADWQKKINLVNKHKAEVSDMTELKRYVKEVFGIEPEETESIVSILHTVDIPVEVQEPTDKEKILELIVKLDKGQGCDYSDLITESGIPEEDVDAIVNKLLDESSCFEPKPGKIKRL